MRLPSNHTDSNGFTIIELMIATGVFGVVLLILILGISDFFNEYYKATVQSSVQTTVEEVTSRIEQSIQNSPGTPSFVSPDSRTGAPGYFCAGGEEFVFYIGKEVPVESSYALYQLPVPPGTCYSNPESQSAWESGTSLVGTYYRLLTFSVSAIGDLPEWAIDIRLAYTSEGASSNGDDLLCSPSADLNGPGGCGISASTITDFTAPDIICKSGAGSQFCSIAGLQSIVEQRVSE